jgi:hypothetical protein
VKEEADRLGFRTKCSTTANGAARGGKPLSRGDVEIVDRHFKTGEIGTQVDKSLLDAARTTFGGLPSARENVDAIRSRIKLFAKLAETYCTFGDLAAALDAAQTERRLAGQAL